MIIWAPPIFAVVKADDPEADSPHGRYPQTLQLVNERFQPLRRGRFAKPWQLALAQNPRRTVSGSYILRTQGVVFPTTRPFQIRTKHSSVRLLARDFLCGNCLVRA